MCFVFGLIFFLISNYSVNSRVNINKKHEKKKNNPSILSTRFIILKHKIYMF